MTTGCDAWLRARWKTQLERRVVAPVHVLEREEHAAACARASVIACASAWNSRRLSDSGSTVRARRRVGKQRARARGRSRRARPPPAPARGRRAPATPRSANRRTRSSSGAYGIERSASKHAPARRRSPRRAPRRSWRGGGATCRRPPRRRSARRSRSRRAPRDQHARTAASSAVAADERGTDDVVPELHGGRLHVTGRGVNDRGVRPTCRIVEEWT